MDKRFVKKCRVCGDKALSFNFNGLCCEPCKIFFRRNAHNSELRCYHSGNCPMTVMTRKTCQLCRLNKCFDIGMQKDMIKDAKSVDLSSCTQCRSILSSKNVSLSELLSEALAEESIDNEEREEIKVNVQINEKMDANKYMGCATESLMPYEWNCLEIIKKASLIFPEAPPNGHQIIGFASDLAQMFNNQEYQIQNMLTFVNLIEGFQSLKLHDQLSVFKKAFPEILLLHSAFNFNFEKNACLAPMNPSTAIYIKLEELYFGANSDTSIELHRLLAFKVKEEMESDVILRELVSVLLMFSPKDNNISCYEYIRHQYFYYSYLLERYLQYKYTNSRKAIKKHSQIKQIVQDIGTFKHALYDVVSRNLDYNKVSGVLSEIYLPVKSHQPSVNLHSCSKLNSG